jgi:hypothetical protein
MDGATEIQPGEPIFGGMSMKQLTDVTSQIPLSLSCQRSWILRYHAVMADIAVNGARSTNWRPTQSDIPNQSFVADAEELEWSTLICHGCVLSPDLPVSLAAVQA